jgi:hypothetical protein
MRQSEKSKGIQFIVGIPGRSERGSRRRGKWIRGNRKGGGACQRAPRPQEMGKNMSVPIQFCPILDHTVVQQDTTHNLDVAPDDAVASDDTIEGGVSV